MPSTSARTGPPQHPHRSVAAALVLAVAVLLGTLVLPMGSTSTRTIDAVLRGDLEGLLPDATVDTADGELPDGVTAFDDQHPGIARLDPELLAALQAATSDAAAAGVELQVNSGWRSPAHQAQLLRDAVAEHGSEEEAARWAATPETSPHVSGLAVDVGPETARTWLARHGPAYGLCRVYDNEPWHFEHVEGGCPPTYPDPTFDPRLG